MTIKELRAKVEAHKAELRRTGRTGGGAAQMIMSEAGPSGAASVELVDAILAVLADQESRLSALESRSGKR